MRTNAGAATNDDGLSDQIRDPSRGERRFQLWVEMLVLFVGAPLAMAFYMPPPMIYVTIGGLLLIGATLLALTPGWRWRRLVEGGLLRHWPLLLAFTLGAAIVIGALVVQLVPERLLSLPLQRPELMLMIAALYPVMLALPQEILFRPLFFERYGRLFANDAVAIGVNSALFGLAHLFYWNLPAVVLSALGSLVFAIAYRRLGSFPLAWALHVIGGLLVFGLGLGVFFYHGAIAP